MSAAWECEGAVKRYAERKALDGATFRCGYGQVTALLGHNGAGKSTLFRAAAGLVRLDAGTMLVGGHPPGSTRAQQATSYMPEQPDLYPGVSVWEHVTFIALAYRLSRWEPRARHLLERFELGDRRDALPHELSQGLRRRLALVMALLHGAEVLLLDEPFNGLDPHSAVRLRTTLSELAADGAAVVVATHILHDAQRLADQVIVLECGRVKAGGDLPSLAREAGLSRRAGMEEIYLALTSESR
ncbi:ABC transporter ATP-binding protein [Nonomuraea sp. NPDC050783]|uniref:ABC transporter ATP-binding protein n=1 Tax=Nonomuraea sp. NPDC050783 TaxID=3154634 RepID=UPI003465A33C